MKSLIAKLLEESPDAPVSPKAKLRYPRRDIEGFGGPYNWGQRFVSRYDDAVNRRFPRVSKTGLKNGE